MLNNRDGGRVALAGFLYQIVGSLGWKARACAPWSGTTSDSDELEGLLELIRSAELMQEQFGQDAVLRLQRLGLDTNDKCVIAQFKYSLKAKLSLIRLKEFTDIVKRLDQSAERVQDHNSEAIGYILITNRQLSREAEAQRKVTQPQVQIVKASLEEWEEDLRRFAHQFGVGVTDAEIEEGINKLVGNLFRQIGKGEDASVTKKSLVKAFTGYEDARPLIPEYVNQVSRKHLKDIKDQLGLRGQPVRRQILDEITKAISEQRALLILHGLGGCGKTVALWQWTDELMSAYSQNNGAFTEFQLANDTPRFWIADVICRWGNIIGHPSRSSEQVERVLERLHLANPSVSPPIMHLGLDGLDEKIGSIDREDVIKNMLNWFWEEDKAARQEFRPPKAILVITCRDLEDLMREWLYLDISGFGPSGSLPQKITIGDFSPEELQKAAQASLSTELYERIESALQLIGGYKSYHLSATAHFGTKTPFVSAINERVLEALKHPAMWRSFLELTSEVQAGVLDGDFSAVHQMAKIFVEWFCKKTRRRDPERASKYLLQILPEIAYHCQNNARFRQSRVRDWVEPACKTNLINNHEAGFLYDEALSAGIIRKDDANFWYWRHELVLEYLAALKGVQKL